MTTTKELREALQSTEPAFAGFEVEAIRRQARRIRRRQRIAGAALGVSVLAGGAVAVPHVAEHARRDEADAAIADPASSAPMDSFTASVRPEPRALPKVTADGHRLPVGGGTYIWLRPPGGGSTGPHVCSGRSATGNPTRCDVLDRAPDGTVNWQIVRHGDDRILIAVVDGAVGFGAEVGSSGETPVSMYDLGFGYQAVVVTTAARVTDEPFAVTAMGKDGAAIARWTGVLASRSEAMGLVAVPASWPQRTQVSELPDAPVLLWTERRPGEAKIRFCTAPRDASYSADCTPLSGTADGVAHAFGVTTPDGKLDIESVVTSAPIAAVTAVLNGASAPVVRLDVGNGYQLLASSFRRGGAGASTLELSGYDGKQRKVVRFTVGIG